MNTNLTFTWMALSLAGLAHAQQDSPPAPQSPEGKPRPGAFLERLKEMDKNGDGQISKDEAPAQAWDSFLSKRDANNDGVLTKEELMAGGPGGPGGPGGGRFNPAEMIMRMDADKDGKVTQAEAGERWERMGRMDKNGDGAVTKDEIPAFGPGGSGGPGGPGGGRFNPAEMIMKMDADKDGKVTQAEAGERWERMGKMDKNGDGAVTKDEIPAFGPDGPGGPGAGHFNPAEMIMRMDADKDGKVTQAEAGERWERMGKMDKNGDGAVTKDEIPAFGPGGPQGKPGAGKTPQAPASES